MDVSLAGMQTMQTMQISTLHLMWSMWSSCKQSQHKEDRDVLIANISLYSAVIKLCVCVFSYFPLTDRSVAAPAAAEIDVIMGCIVKEVV